MLTNENEKYFMDPGFFNCSRAVWFPRTRATGHPFR